VLTQDAGRPVDGPVLTDWAARVVDVVRWVAVAVLVADVLVGLVTIPRDSSLDEFQRDLAGGRVRSASVVDPGTLRSTYVLTGHHPGNADPASAVLWRAGAVGYRLADLPRDGSTPRLTLGQAPARDDLLQRWSGASTVVLVVLVLVLMLGPQPRRVTKWALFWWFLTPLNAGLIWALVREAPWAPAARALPVPAPHRFQPDDRRFTGGLAFLLMLLATTIGQLVLQSLAQHTW
jgi:hypothetical protein